MSEVCDLVRANQVYAAWDRLNEEYGDAIRRFAARHYPRTADKFCGDFWNTVYRALPDYSGSCTPLTWLVELAHRIGSPARPASIGLGGVLLRASALACADGLTERRVNRAIASLSDEERSLLELRYLFARDTRELSIIFGESEDVVDRQLHAILIGLRDTATR